MELPAWSVGVGAEGVAAPAAEICGWHAARAADSISAVRAALAFRAVRGVGLIGLLLLGVSRLYPGCLPRPGCAPAAPGPL